MIAVIDYGMGNIHSVYKAVESQGGQVCIAAGCEEVRQADKLILPGVGAFDDAMAELERRSLTALLKEQVITQRKPFLGICLGMQLLFEESEEAKTAGGLGMLAGRVVRFREKPGCKVPHMGWNRIEPVVAGDGSVCPLLAGIGGPEFVYFCHSYYPEPAESGDVASRTEYITPFASGVWRENIFGVQFHPEKSQGVGLRMIKNFVDIC
ncbi:MAG: imidazole glycerol phosphate synthase subunit HisH [Candidatus Omnitrophica bacterium]|nr:imidazole glycerol phosphate synthase subunit HisH [Candidatus Omnitrophota bacterium]